MKEQTGAGTDVRSRLDVRFGLQPVKKDLDRLPLTTSLLAPFVIFFRILLLIRISGEVLLL